MKNKIPPELVSIAEFVNKYFDVIGYKVNKDSKWVLVVKELRGHLVEVIIDPFDVKDKEQLGSVMEKIAESIVNYRDSGLII